MAVMLCEINKEICTSKLRKTFLSFRCLCYKTNSSLYLIPNSEMERMCEAVRVHMFVGVGTRIFVVFCFFISFFFYLGVPWWLSAKRGLFESCLAPP